MRFRADHSHYATVYVDHDNGQTDKHQFSYDETLFCWATLDYFIEKYPNTATISLILKGEFIREL